ncbi:uncharacterized protein LOC142246577 [Anomaloglossus baeobatrachus]|uniref:uncharacterized protein LOC142246577 n=1 Tax=Anomaloglossus baeobatrachus TaxID=238106 RepID=UPI003F4FD893
MKSLEKWMKSSITDCQLVNPTITKDWKTKVEKCAIVIVYSTAYSYRSFMEKMGPYMEHWKGNQNVIVVIGDIQASGNEGTSEWDVHIFTKAELQWIVQDPRLQEMSGKIRQIREIVLVGYEKETSKEKQKLLVTFVSISNIDKLQNTSGCANPNKDPPQKKQHWLEPLLRDHEKMEISYCQISEIKNFLPKEKGTVLTCILHFTKEAFKKMIKDKKHSDLQNIKKEKGKKNLAVVVVVDDLDDTSSDNDLRAQYEKSKFHGLGSLFLFRREELQKDNLDYISAELTAKDKCSKLQESIDKRVKASESSDNHDGPCSSTPDDGEEETRPPGKLGIVGIFSRSSNTDYSWIETELKSPYLSREVSSVRPFYISNNQTLKFYEELGVCSFGILYHTKNRGRVNVTDVTDSLYDEELETMSQILRRQNVIVVIDDLKDSNDEEKERLLTTQPSIKKYAIHLLLFSEQDKTTGEHEKRLRDAMKSLAAGKKMPRVSDTNTNAKKSEKKGPGENLNKAGSTQL